MSKIIGGPLSSGVRTQLNIRRDKYGKSEDRTNDDLQYISSRTGWVKLTSGVNLTQGGIGDKLAKEYILIGGTYGRFGDEAYSTFGGNTGKGFRPMPGITGVQIRSLNRFGTLKEATVTFNCWDVDQLTNLELLYMRPGFTALLEWGHSLYFTTSDNLVKTPSTVTRIFSQTVQKGDKTETVPSGNKQQIYNEIEELRESSAYNYDGIFGFIKNFSWSFRPDGGYDCTTNIVSIGELIESLTVDTDVPSNTKNNSSPASGSEALPATMIENVMKEFVKNTENPNISGNFPDYWDKYKQVTEGDDKGSSFYFKVTTKGTSTETTAGDAEKFSWIRLRDLCGYINAAILIDNTEKNIIKLNTSLSRSSKFRTFKDHVSSDPRICIIAGRGAESWYGNLPNGVIALDIIKKYINGSSTNEILNIYVNTHFVAEVMTSLRDQPKESRTLVNMMKPILDGLTEALGNINEFDLHYEEETFTYYIVDRQLERTTTDNSPNNLPTLAITGLSSTVTQFNFTTKLSPAITNMLAISAQASSADVGIEAEALLTWNRGLKDRIISQRKQRVNEGDKEEISAERQKAQKDREVTIMKGFTSFWRDNQYIKDEIDAAKTNFTQYATTYVQYSDSGTGSTPAGIIPFEVGIQMDGISGIKIGQAFKISEGIMPNYYNGVVGFIVTGIDHDIQNNRWVTNLKAQTIVIGQGKSKTALPVEEKKGLPESSEAEVKEEVKKETKSESKQGTPGKYYPSKVGGGTSKTIDGVEYKGGYMPDSVMQLSAYQNLRSVSAISDNKRIRLYKPAAEALDRLLEQAIKDKIEFKLNSAYRTVDDQKRTYDENCKNNDKLPQNKKTYTASCISRKKNNGAAIPGTSNHGFGLAVDFGDKNGTLITVGGSQYKWLKENGPKYNFKRLDWKNKGAGEAWEAWHWEYQYMDD